MTEGTTQVLSEVVGLLQSGSKMMATLHAKQYPEVLQLCAQWMEVTGRERVKDLEEAKRTAQQAAEDAKKVKTWRNPG